MLYRKITAFAMALMDVSADAEDAMKWMTAKGIIIGSSDKLLPKDEITKAQLAAMLMRFDKLELA